MEHILKEEYFWSTQRTKKRQNIAMLGVLDHSGQLCQNYHIVKSSDNPEMKGRTRCRIVKFRWKRVILIADVVVAMQVNNVSNI